MRFFVLKGSILKIWSVVGFSSLGVFSSAFANYIQNDIFIGNNAKPYVRNIQYAPAVSLFKTIKWKNTDKAFAQKHWKALIGIIDGFLNTQKDLDGEKRKMVSILLNILKDHYNEYGTDKVSNNTPTINTNNDSNSHVRPNNNTKTNNNSGLTPSSEYDNGSISYDNGFNDFFDSPSTSKSSNNNNNFGSGFGDGSSKLGAYTVEQLIRDTGVSNSVAKRWVEGQYTARCAFGDCGVLKRENFARTIKMANYLKNNIGVRDSDSQDEKIVKIYNYINQHAEGKSIPFPYARASPELNQWLAEHPEVRDGDKVLETWNGSCATLSSLYAEFLHLAGVDATIYYVGGMASNGQGGHGFLEINGRFSDVTNRWSTDNPFSWPSLEIRPDSISRHTT